MSESTQTIGQRLKEKREAMGLSLMDISEVTKLSVRQLSSLERDAYKELPSDIYVWLFLRTYAKHLGFDVQEIKRLYEEAVRPAPSVSVDRVATSRSDSSAPTEDPEVPSARVIVPRPVWYALGILAVAGFAILLSQLPVTRQTTFEPSRGGADTLAAGGATLVTVAPSTSASLTVTPEGKIKSVLPPVVPPSRSVAPSKAAEGLLKVKAKAPTWFEVTVDGADQFSLSMKPGEERTWLARKSFRVWIGYPPGVEISLNGTTLTLNSPQGEPLRDVEIFPDGRVEYHLSSVDAP